MNTMIETVTGNPAAAIAGAFAMVCFAAWPLFRSRATMLLIYIGNNAGFALHYWLLGQPTAAMMNGLLGVQTLVAIRLERRPHLQWIYYALMPVVAAACVLTWNGAPSLLAALATALSTLGRMQRSQTSLRILMLATTPLWAAHDLLAGSLPGLCADALGLATGAVMLAREAGQLRLFFLRRFVRARRWAVGGRLARVPS